MSMSSILQSEPVVALAATVVGTLWSFFRSSDWYERLKRRRYYRAVEALEAGVQHTYDTYVRAVKDASEDGTLTERERRRARQLAREAAESFGRTRGVDVARELGREYLDTWIEKIVRRMKNGE